MTHTTFMFTTNCPCYECMLVPICQNKRRDHLLKDCALLCNILMPIYKEIESDEDNIEHITIELIPLKMSIEFNRRGIFYWSHYPLEGKS